jgi:hypothetical protein
VNMNVLNPRDIKTGIAGCGVSRFKGNGMGKLGRIGQSACSAAYSPGNCDSVGGTYDGDNEVCVCPANPTPIIATTPPVTTMVGQGLNVVGTAAGSVVGATASGLLSGLVSTTGIPAVAWYVGLGVLAYILVKK